MLKMVCAPIVWRGASKAGQRSERSQFRVFECGVCCWIACHSSDSCGVLSMLVEKHAPCTWCRLGLEDNLHRVGCVFAVNQGNDAQIRSSQRHGLPPSSSSRASFMRSAKLFCVPNPVLVLLRIHGQSPLFFHPVRFFLLVDRSCASIMLGQTGFTLCISR